MRPVYQQIALTLKAIENCRTRGDQGWLERLHNLVAEHMPRGSGFDNGTFLFDRSTPNKLMFSTSFHHMDEHGGYDGWTGHTVTVTPSLAFGFEIKINGRDRNDIKEYIIEEFDRALREEVKS
jgi:hypothetical protein